MMRPPMPLKETQRAIVALRRIVRARGAAVAARARLDGLMQKVCALRAAGDCTAPELDHSAGVYAGAVLRLAMRRAAC